MVTPKNLFIALEGIDGSGKSTQVRLLADKLTALGHKVHVTCEPTTNRIGRMIRDVFTGRDSADQSVIAALFAADRLDHILNEKDGLLTMLQDGYTVISDRYYFSSYAYHSVYVPMDWVIQLNDYAQKLLQPDLNIYIDVAPKVAMDRINANRSSVEMYETLDNLKAVYDNYHTAFELMKDKEKIVSIDGNQDIQSISLAILSKVNF